MSRRSRFVQPRRRRAASAPPTVDDVTAEIEKLLQTESGLQLVPVMGTAAQEWLAPRMWSAGYKQLFEDEYARNSLVCGGGLVDLPPSSYRQRLRGEPMLLYDARRLRYAAFASLLHSCVSCVRAGAHHARVRTHARSQSLLRLAIAVLTLIAPASLVVPQAAARRDGHRAARQQPAALVSVAAGALHHLFQLGIGAHPARGGEAASAGQPAHDPKLPSHDA